MAQWGPLHQDASRRVCFVFLGVKLLQGKKLHKEGMQLHWSQLQQQALAGAL